MASENVVIDAALPMSKSCFGDVRLCKIDMYKKVFYCDGKGCNLRKVRMLFEMHKSKIVDGGDCCKRCYDFSSLCMERECIDYTLVP